MGFKEKESRRNQAIYTINIYCSKSSLPINDPQTQVFILEVISKKPLSGNIVRSH